jgi:hypothetical protein
VPHHSELSKCSRTDSARRVRHLPLNPPPEDTHLQSPSTGKPVSHQFAKELLVGFAGAEVDKLAETKGMDFIDREKAKHHAKENVENMYDQHYIERHGADQYDP